MNFFQLTIHNMDLNDEYQAARKHYSTPGTLAGILQTVGVKGLLDDGSVLKASTKSTDQFLKFTDSLIEHMNDNLDTLACAPDVLKMLLETEFISADSFVPDLDISPSHDPNRVDVTYKGVGLAFSFFSSVVDPNSDEDDIVELAMDIMVEPRVVDYLGRLTINEDATIHWSATDEARTDTSANRNVEIEIPLVNVEDVVSEQITDGV